MESYLRRPFVCLECERRFTSKLFLKRHSAVHSNSRNFKCDLCLSTYKYKKGLNRHIKKFHPDHYTTLNQFPIRRKPKIKFEENASPIFKIRRKTEEGWVEEIPSVTPTFKIHPDSFKDDDSSQDKQESCKKLKNLRKQPNFFRFFMQSLSSKKDEKKIHEFDRNSEKGLSESFKEFNKVLSESVLKYNQSYMQTDRDSSKGFVPVKVDEDQPEDKVSYANPHKKIEYLEDLLKKWKTRDCQLKDELRVQMERNNNLKGVFKRLNRLYYLKIGNLRKRIKIEENTVELKVEEEFK